MTQLKRKKEIYINVSNYKVRRKNTINIDIMNLGYLSAQLGIKNMQMSLVLQTMRAVVHTISSDED